MYVMSLRGVNIDFNGHNKSNVMTYNKEYIYENIQVCEQFLNAKLTSKLQRNFGD